MSDKDPPKTRQPQQKPKASQSNPKSTRMDGNSSSQVPFSSLGFSPIFPSPPQRVLHTNGSDEPRNTIGMSRRHGEPLESRQRTGSNSQSRHSFDANPTGRHHEQVSQFASDASRRSSNVHAGPSNISGYERKAQSSFQNTLSGLSPILPSSSQGTADARQSSSQHPGQGSKSVKSPLKRVIPGSSSSTTSKGDHRKSTYQHHSTPTTETGNHREKPQTSTFTRWNSTKEGGSKRSVQKGVSPTTHRPSDLKSESSKPKSQVQPKPKQYSFDDSEKLPGLPPVKPVATPTDEEARLDLLARHQKFSPIRFEPKQTDRPSMAPGEKRLMNKLLGKEKDLDDLSGLGKYRPMDPRTSQGSPLNRSTFPTKFGENTLPFLKTKENSDESPMTQRSPGSDTLMFMGVRRPGVVYGKTQVETPERSDEAPRSEPSTSSCQKGESEMHRSTRLTSKSDNITKSHHHEERSGSTRQTLDPTIQYEHFSASGKGYGAKRNTMTKEQTSQKAATPRELNITSELSESWNDRTTPFYFDLKGHTQKESRAVPSSDISSPMYRFDSSKQLSSEGPSTPSYPFSSNEKENSKEFSWAGRKTPFTYHPKFQKPKEPLHQHEDNLTASSGSARLSTPPYRFDSMKSRSDSLSTPTYRFNSEESTSEQPSTSHHGSRFEESRSVPTSSVLGWNPEVSDEYDSHFDDFESIERRENSLAKIKQTEDSTLASTSEAWSPRLSSTSSVLHTEESSKGSHFKYTDKHHKGDVGAKTSSSHQYAQPKTDVSSRMQKYSIGNHKEDSRRLGTPSKRAETSSKRTQTPSKRQENSPKFAEAPVGKTNLTAFFKLSGKVLDQLHNTPDHLLTKQFHDYVEKAIDRRPPGRDVYQDKGYTNLIRSMDKNWYDYVDRRRLSTHTFAMNKSSMEFVKDRERYWEYIKKNEKAPVNWILRHYLLCRKLMEPTIVSDIQYLSSLPKSQLLAKEAEFLKSIYLSSIHK